MSKELNILFTSSGRRVELIKHFQNVYNALNVQGKIITADLKDNSPTSKISNKHYLVPRVTDSSYIGVLEQICRTESIDLIIPLIDTELVLLSKNEARFKEQGVKLLVSSTETHILCNDKNLTAKFFEENHFDFPKIYDIQEIIKSKTINEPLLIKPAKGSSGIGVNIITDLEQLIFFNKYLDEPILQELVKGNEYTIDVFTDFKGEILTAVPRLRIETRAGEVSKGKTIRNELLIEKAKQIVKALPNAKGCITVQCFLNEMNQVKFIEINPRFGGGAPLSLEAGADYAKYLVCYLLNLPIPDINNWQENLLMLRYDAAIFLQDDSV